MKFSMRILWLIPVLTAALITTACSDLLSVEPLATDSNIIFDASLIGVWSGSDGEKISCVVSVQEGENHTYEIVWSDVGNDRKYRLHGRLARINGQHILDVTPHESSAFYISGHAFLYVKDVPDGLEIQFLDSEWLQDQVKKSISLPHYDLEGSTVITGATDQLQTFISEFGLNQAARSEPISLRRLHQ